MKERAASRVTCAVNDERMDEAMGRWGLPETHRTTGGTVAAGRAGKGPPLILAHGWPWSSFSFHRIIPPLSEIFAVHWYDMPGYGQSAKPSDDPTSLDIQGEVFCEMLRAWGLSRPRVLAHDMGGAVTLRAHLLHGVEFEKYALMNVVAMRPWGSDFFDHMGRHTDAFRGLPAHIHRALVEAYMRGALVKPLQQEDFDGLVAPWLTDDGTPSFYKQFAEADEALTAEVEPHFGNVRCEVAVLWGEADPWIPLSRGRALHALMPGASFEVLDGVGHMPQLEAPDRLLPHLLRFFATA